MRAARILELLPDVFRRAVVAGDPLDTLIGVMEELHDPIEVTIDGFDAYLDPYRCPAPFVAYLAQWVDLGWLVSNPSAADATHVEEGHLRHVVASAENLAADRGTASGLARFLELATGCRPFAIDDDSGAAFHLVVRAPETARHVRALIERIVHHEKPAFATASIAFGDDGPTPIAGLGRAAFPPPIPPPPPATSEDSTDA